ncbi:MAG: gliding motility-associated C-terminal domain-containing protein [Vicingaceae bacterium]
MRNYFKIFSLAFTILISSAIEAQPISEVFAGGEIAIEYAGNPNAPCTGPQAYNFILKFYRDCPTGTFEDSKTINLWSPSNNNLVIPITLNNFTSQGTIDNLCLKSDPICTAGRWYRRNNVTLPFPANDWKIFYGTIPMGNIANGVRGRNYQSPATFNIEQGQTFFLITTFSNLRFCGEVEGVLQKDLLDTIRIENVSFNTSARWITPHPVETFCDGQSYNYKLPVVDDDVYTIDLNLNNNITSDTLQIRDSLSYELVTTLKANAQGVTYYSSEGYSPSTPFPSSTPITFDKKNGVLSFTPDLALGQGGFIAAVTFIVREHRTVFEVDSTCLIPGGGCLPSERTPVIRKSRKLINSTYRQMRFVFDTQCNKRLPEFSADDFNTTEAAWEYECASTTLDFRMSEPMLIETALADPKWLSMYRGKPGNPRDDNAIGIDSIVPLNRDDLDQFTRFRVYLFKPIGPGNYTLFPKPNKQPTGIKNRCGFELEEGSVEIPIYINTDYTYEFGDSDGLKEFCYPADLPFRVDALQGQEKLRSVASLYTWRFVEFDPNEVRDSLYPPTSTYNLPVDTNIQGDLEFPEGTWEVGIGLDFGYTYNDTAYEAYCYDADNFEVLFYQNDPVEIPDFDLCADEPWPLIDLDSMTTKHNAVSYFWTYFNRPQNRWDAVGGSSNSSKKNSSFDVASIGSGLGKPYIITSEVELEAGKCFERDTFIVLKDLVKVNIDFGNDTTICPGFEFNLTNIESYLVPDSMGYQWYLNDVAIPGADSNSVFISDSGMYKLEVTKRTENSQCVGYDSVLINVADSLGIPQPLCTQVTFKDGDIEQSFFIPAMKGADYFEVRTIDPFGNEGEWIFPSVNQFDHIARGKQLKLEARGVNTEVEEDAPCRYGPIGLAEACNAVVKPVNVFTPNGDGINEFLRFDLLEVFPGSPLQIYNRWGELIYESDSYQNDWDGEDYSDGTYFYVLEVNDESQGILKGTFTILR